VQAGRSEEFSASAEFAGVLPEAVAGSQDGKFFAGA
jgi:hypothetical protein